MKKTIATFLTAVTLSLVSACGGSASASAAGTYQLDKDALIASMMADMPAEAKKDEKAAKEMMSNLMPTISMELKADGTTAVTTSMGGKSETEAGSWKLEGTKLSMTSKENGKDVTKTADYANGSFSMEHEEGGKKVKMTFKKK